MSNSDDIGVIIFVEIAGRGVTGSIKDTPCRIGLQKTTTRSRSRVRVTGRSRSRRMKKEA